jgi:hypothetical protein
VDTVGFAGLHPGKAKAMLVEDSLSVRHSHPKPVEMTLIRMEWFQLRRQQVHCGPVPDRLGYSPAEELAAKAKYRGQQSF